MVGQVKKQTVSTYASTAGAGLGIAVNRGRALGAGSVSHCSLVY
jgi:hypothetical protein